MEASADFRLCIQPFGAAKDLSWLTTLLWLVESNNSGVGRDTRFRLADGNYSALRMDRFHERGIRKPGDPGSLVSRLGERCGRHRAVDDRELHGVPC